MNIWIKRSLSAAAVAGGIVVLGATTAQADDGGQSSHESDTQSSFSAPLEIGGLSLGSDSSSSSSESSTSTSTDEHGTHTTESSREDASTSSTGLTIDPTRIDPGAMLAQQSLAASGSAGGHGSGADSSTDESSTEASASAPIEIGGLSLHDERESASTSQESSSSTGEDGTHTSESTTQEHSSSSAGLGTGSLAVDPQAALSQASSATSDARGHHSSSDASSSTGSASAGIPFVYEGGYLTFDQQDGREQTHSSTSADGRGTHTTTGSTTEENSTSAEYVVGAITADPAGHLAQESARDQAQHGDDEASASTSSTEGSLSGPIAIDGLAGAVARESASTDERTTSGSDEHGTYVERTATESSSAVGAAGESGRFEAAPSLGFAQDRSDAREDHARDESASDSSTVLGAALPVDYEGFTAGAFSDRADASRSATESHDQHGTHTTTHEQHEQSAHAPAFGFDGFSGDPAGSFDLAKASEYLRWNHGGHHVR